MAPDARDGRRESLPELLATILEAHGATVTRVGPVWEASLPPDLAKSLGVERVRFAAAPGRAARGSEVDAAMIERILLLGRSRGQVTRLLAHLPGAADPPPQWIQLHWRVRFGSDELPEELYAQVLPVRSGSGPAPPRSALRAATPDEAARIPAPEPAAMELAWQRALRVLESRIRRRLRPYEERERRELHREMRTLSAHYRSLIAEERAGRTRRPEDREAGRMLLLKEDWERKLGATIRRRAMDVEAVLVAAALVTGWSDGSGPTARGRGGAGGAGPAPVAPAAPAPRKRGGRRRRAV